MNIGVEIPAVDQLHLRGAFFGEVNVSVCQSGWSFTFEIDGLSVRSARRRMSSDLPVATMRPTAQANASWIELSQRSCGFYHEYIKSG
jgi:hypothetical protein